jgi:divalent metal cation (Fe/Co/Zn/Cd) transporter
VGFLSISCFELGRTALSELVRGGHAVAVTNLDFGVLALSLGVNVTVSRFERARGRALASDLLVADASHMGADAVDRSASMADAHAIADEVEDRLKEDLQLHEVLVHVEPC